MMRQFSLLAEALAVLAVLPITTGWFGSGTLSTPQQSWPVAGADV